MKASHCLSTLLTLALTATVHAADPATGISARELAAKLSSIRQDGSSYVRLRMEIQGGKQETLQIQIKQRRGKDSSQVLYQVLFPKERKGESVLLHKSSSRSG